METAGYDAGALMDPLDRRVIGDHYAHTHFAWAAALLFRQTGDEKWLTAARDAIAFHLRTSPEEYPPGNWDYHWDFNNLAFIETFGLLSGDLTADERGAWKDGLRAWKTNPHSAVNWLAMRALGAFRRGILLENPADAAVARRLLDRVLAAETGDGFFDDIPGKSRPTQYHAYTACLLHRMREMAPARIDAAVVRAARCLLVLTGPDGDMNAVGRGQRQIFGYAAAVYLFRAAASLDPDAAGCYAWAVRRIGGLLAAHLAAEGFLPLVLHSTPAPVRAGWYDYHHLSVYNAFTALWLLLASELPEISAMPPVPPRPEDVHLADSGLLSLRGPHIFSLWSAGEDGVGYTTEAGITPHALYVGDECIFRCPCGPGGGKYGSWHTSSNGPHRHPENLWSPLVRLPGRDWIAPTGAAGRLRPVRQSRSGPARWRLDHFVQGIRRRRIFCQGAHFVQATDAMKIGTPRPGMEIRAASAVFSPEVRQVGRNAFETAGGTLIRLWGDGAPARFTGTLDAANGRVRVAAVDAPIRKSVHKSARKPDFSGKKGSQAVVSGGFRVRQGPGAEPGRIPGVLCVSWDPWSPLWKRKQRLLRDMAATGKAGTILYAEPPVPVVRVADRPSLLRENGPEGRRMRRALTGAVERRGDQFYLTTPLRALPGERTFSPVRDWNWRLVARQLRRRMRRLGMRSAVLWLYHPSQTPLLDELADAAELIVFDWTDDWVAALPDSFPEAQRRELARRQDELLQRCDLVFGVSEVLCRRAREYGPHVFHLANATDPDVFRPAGSAALHPIFADAGGAPKLVYLSQITDRLDVDLLANAARMRPDWQFFLVGPQVCAPSFLDPLRNAANIRLTGPLPYAEAAIAVAQGDVCILPHKTDELTRTLDPIKLYDYLATGRPVVSTDVAMHPEIRPLIRIADAPDAFVAAAAASLNEPPGAGIQRREAMTAHVWSARAAEAADRISRFFPAGKNAARAASQPRIQMACQTTETDMNIGSMKIGVDARILTLPELRGMAEYLLSILREWPRPSDEFILFAENPAKTDPVRTPARYSWRFFPSPRGSRIQIQDWFALPKAARREKPDLFWSPANRTIPFLACPQIVTIHDTLLQEKVAFSDPVEAAYFRSVQPFLARRFADRIITISHFSKDRIKKVFRCPGSKTDIIYNGMAPPATENAGDREPEQMLVSQGVLPKSRPPFLYAMGAEAEWKNTAGLLRAFARLSPRHEAVHLIVSGIQARAARKFQNLAADLGLETRVHLHAYLPEDQVTALLKTAVAFVYPSLFEGFGLPPLTAMRYGTPVLAANASCLPEVLGEAAFLADAASPEAFARSMDRMLDDAGLRERLRENGRRQLERYDWGRCADAHCRVFQESAKICGRRSHGKRKQTPPSAKPQILILENGAGFGGALTSIASFLGALPADSPFEYHLLTSYEQDYIRAGGALRHVGVLPRRRLYGPESILQRHLGRIFGARAGNIAYLLDLVSANAAHAVKVAAHIRRHHIRLVHLNNGILINDAGILGAALAGVPCVVHVRGIEYPSRISRLLSRFAAAFLPVSGFITGTLRSLGVPEEKIHVVPEGIDADAFAAAAKPDDGGLLTSERPVVIGMVGCLAGWKGQEILIQALHQLRGTDPSLRFAVRFAGDAPDGSPEPLERLRRLADDGPARDAIFFHGHVSDVASFISGCDVLVHASTEPEPFGRVVLEAMTMGKAIAAASAGGPAEVLRHGQTGLLTPPGDPSALASALLSLLKDREYRGQLGVAAGKDVRKRFGIQRHVQRLLRIHAEALKRSSEDG